MIRLSTAALAAALAVMPAGADALGRLGWRSPLRSNALTALSDEVLGNPAPWRAAGGPRL